MTTTLPRNVQNILNTINAAYEGGELRINEDLPRGTRGDTLADFIRTEVIEVTQGEDRPLQSTLDALRGAIERLEACMSVLEPLTEADLEREPAEAPRGHQYLMGELCDLWNQLADTAVTEDGRELDDPFLHFPKGTDVHNVWRWFEQQNPAFLVGEAGKQIGAQHPFRSL